ncbi:hypothetical protein KEJ32_05780, partial [Candidatus Bathyarchaeota archaeon]|nr:hypothetical protein [Candidatus Bathyarchaeota archaeon]
IYIYMASNNRIYHNTFYENGLDIFVENGAVNYFDGGYPSGGNYWEGYSGADSNHGPGQNIAGSDGIIDTPYSPSAGIIDNYPLAAPFVAIRAGTWNGLTFSFEVISNSTISDLQFNPQIGPFLKFNVSGMYETTGFCRITIPKKVLWTENSWNITVNGQKIENYLELIDEENTYLYFTYNHSTKTVTIQGTHIIPELQPSILPLLFMALSILAIIFANKTQKKGQTS